MVGKLPIGEEIRETHIRFINFKDYERYINAIDQDYKSEGATFNGYIYKKDTPQFNLVKRSQYGNGYDFKHQIIEDEGTTCYIPSNSYCFIKSTKKLSFFDFKEHYLDFIRKEKRRTKIITMAGIQNVSKNWVLILVIIMEKKYGLEV